MNNINTLDCVHMMFLNKKNMTITATYTQGMKYTYDVYKEVYLEICIQYLYLSNIHYLVMILMNHEKSLRFKITYITMVKV